VGSLDLAFPGVEENPDPTEYRIAYVGNSYIYDVTDWPSSIEGLLADRLASVPSLIATGKHPKVRARHQTREQGDRELRRISAFRPGSTISSSSTGTSATSTRRTRTSTASPISPHPIWPDALTHMLVDVNRKLSAKHIAFVVVIHPVRTASRPVKARGIPLPSSSLRRTSWRPTRRRPASS